MKQILIINFDTDKLNNIKEVTFQTTLTSQIDYILTTTIDTIPAHKQHLILRNIELLDYNLQKSIQLFEIGKILTDYSIISYNCMSGYMNNYLSKPQIGPCGFWRYDIIPFYSQLLLDNETFFNNLFLELTYSEKNGHYYAKNSIHKISFTHYKKTTTLRIAQDYEKRIKKFSALKTIFILVIDQDNFTLEQLETLIKARPKAIILTNYDIQANNVFNFSNQQRQFYLKAMHFLKDITPTDLTRFISLIHLNMN